MTTAVRSVHPRTLSVEPTRVGFVLSVPSAKGRSTIALTRKQAQSLVERLSLALLRNQPSRPGEAEDPDAWRDPEIL